MSKTTMRLDIWYEIWSSGPLKRFLGHATRVKRGPQGASSVFQWVILENIKNLQKPL